MCDVERTLEIVILSFVYRPNLVRPLCFENLLFFSLQMKGYETERTPSVHLCASQRMFA
jgi:hypothetical protein